MRSPYPRTSFLIAAMALVAAGCGGGDGESGTDSGTDTASDPGLIDVADTDVPTAPDVFDPGPGSEDVTVAKDPGVDLPEDPGLKDPGVADPGGLKDPGGGDPGTTDPGSEPGKDVQEPAVCAQLFDEYFAFADSLNVCDGPGQCTRIQSSICAKGKGCQGLLVSSQADWSALLAKANDYGAAGCTLIDDTCECPAPFDKGFGCASGQCVACEYACDMDCVCKKDAAGCDIPECEVDQCQTLLGQITSYAQANDDCTVSSGCAAFQHPICGTFGCFSIGVAAQTDLEPLTTWANEAQALACDDFTCGCIEFSMPACLDGTCRACPPDCTGTCEGMKTAILEEAARLNTCQWTEECWDEVTAICNIPELPCGYSPVLAGENTDLLFNLSEAYVDANCNEPDCGCPPPPDTLYCVEGTCTATPACDKIQARLQDIAADPGAVACSVADDCALAYSDYEPFCPPPDACWCAIALGQAAATEWEYMLEAAEAQGCVTTTKCPCDEVDCTQPQVACTGGVCTVI